MKLETRRWLPALAAALVLIACGGGHDDNDNGHAPAPGPGTSVQGVSEPVESMRDVHGRFAYLRAPTSATCSSRRAGAPHVIGR